MATTKSIAIAASILRNDLPGRARWILRVYLETGAAFSWHPTKASARREARELWGIPL